MALTPSLVNVFTTVLVMFPRTVCGLITRVPELFFTACFSNSHGLFFKRSLSCVCSPRKLIILSFSLFLTAPAGQELFFLLNTLVVSFVGFLLCYHILNLNQEDAVPPLDLNIVSCLLVHVPRLCEIKNFSQKKLRSLKRENCGFT